MLHSRGVLNVSLYQVTLIKLSTVRGLRESLSCWGVSCHWMNSLRSGEYRLVPVNTSQCCICFIVNSSFNVIKKNLNCLYSHVSTYLCDKCQKSQMSSPLMDVLILVWAFQAGQSSTVIENIHTIIAAAAVKFSFDQLTHLFVLIQKVSATESGTGFLRNKSVQSGF